MESAGRVVIVSGLLPASLGLLMLLAPKVPFIGRGPGDILTKREHFTFYFPLVTTFIVSLVLTLTLNPAFRLFQN